MNFEFTKKNTILLIVFITIIVLGLLLNNFRNPKKVIKKEENITLVKDYSHFFTINNAVQTYIDCLQDEEKENLIILLSHNYKDINSITTNNVLSKLGKLENFEYTFESRKMYQEELKENVIRYYIYGDLNQSSFVEYVKPTDYYIIIDSYLKNNTFSVTPYNGDIFKEEK